jgi:hypothetical protein
VRGAECRVWQSSDPLLARVTAHVTLVIYERLSASGESSLIAGMRIKSNLRRRRSRNGGRNVECVLADRHEDAARFPAHLRASSGNPRLVRGRSHLIWGRKAVTETSLWRRVQVILQMLVVVESVNINIRIESDTRTEMRLPALGLLPAPLNHIRHLFLMDAAGRAVLA